MLQFLPHRLCLGTPITVACSTIIYITDYNDCVSRTSTGLQSSHRGSVLACSVHVWQVSCTPLSLNLLRVTGLLYPGIQKHSFIKLYNYVFPVHITSQNGCYMCTPFGHKQYVLQMFSSMSSSFFLSFFTFMSCELDICICPTCICIHSSHRERNTIVLVSYSFISFSSGGHLYI